MKRERLKKSVCLTCDAKRFDVHRQRRPAKELTDVLCLWSIGVLKHFSGAD